MSDSRSRKWQLTINNPVDKGFTHDKIKEALGGFKSLVYWCLCDEIGMNETYHTHVYIAFSNAVRFSTLKNKFPEAHFEMANGTSEQNRDYIRKEGKWKKDRKAETSLPTTFEEYGEMPVERQGQRNDIHDLYDMIKNGCSNFEIIETNPSYMLNIDKVEKARQIVRDESFRRVFRSLDVVYVFGQTGSGKTRDIMEAYGYENVYRVTDYDHPFDSYSGQGVIVFEEFRSSLRISDMLNYLDGYPVELPSRYVNKVACFTRVFILSNVSLELQYPMVQTESLETWLAFLRRIHRVKVYGNGKLREYDNIASYYFRDRVSEQIRLKEVDL